MSTKDEIRKLAKALAQWVTPAELEKTKRVIDDCPGEVLYIATALRCLADDTSIHADELVADGMTLTAETTQQRSTSYAKLYQEIKAEYDGRDEGDDCSPTFVVRSRASRKSKGTP